MTNLVQELSPERFRQKFSGSFFYNEEGVPSIINTLGEARDVHCTTVTGSVHNIRVSPKLIPWDFFSGLAVFKTPKLGWRAGHDGRLLTYLSRDNRSYHRGISQSNIVINHSPLTRWLSRTANFSINLTANKLCALAMNPEFTPLTEGIEAMRRGDILSFAVSPEIAVVPGDEDTYNIYFRQNLAGKIMPDNTLQVTIPLLASYVEDLK